MSGTAESHGLVRRLGPFDATMLVIGGIVGAGNFIGLGGDTLAITEGLARLGAALDEFA